MKNFYKRKHNPIEVIQALWMAPPISHITYDPNMKKGDYDIVRQTTHDGTLIFTNQLFENVLSNVVMMRSYDLRKKPADWSKVEKIIYTIGPIKHSVVVGEVMLPCNDKHPYPGIRERMRMPVIAEIIYKD